MCEIVKKKSIDRHLAIINLFQLDPLKEKPTSSDKGHIMERKNYKNILLIDFNSLKKKERKKGDKKTLHRMKFIN